MIPKKIEENAGEEEKGDLGETWRRFELELDGTVKLAPARELFEAVKQELAGLEKEVKRAKNKIVDSDEEVDKDKLKELIAEYRKFKAKNVKHFSFDSEESKNAYGKFNWKSYLTINS